MTLKTLSLVLLAFSMMLGCKGTRPGPGQTSCTPPAAASLPITLVPQELSQWCWAASGQMVMKNLQTEVTQCGQANDRFHLDDCCPSTTANDTCNTGGWPEFEKHQIRYQKTPGIAVSWSELQKQIGCSKQPVAFSWKWAGGGGHMMVAVGYVHANDGTNLVEVDDPWEPNKGSHYFLTYAEFVSAPDHHDHWDDYYNFSK